jgi:hypothetical protein
MSKIIDGSLCSSAAYRNLLEPVVATPTSAVHL